MLYLTSHNNIAGDIQCGDKSISHRALILAAIADGQSVIRNISTCRDVLTTANCLRALGAEIDICGTTAIVTPWTTPKSGVTLDCENSGTSARLLAGLVAGLGVDATFVGDESLSRRPMDRILQPLAQMGAVFEKGEKNLFRNIPHKLHGAQLSAQVNSAQVKSGVCLAALFADGETSYTEFLPTRDHTENLLKYLGANCICENLTVRIAKSCIPFFEITVTNDISSIAFLVALALLQKSAHIFRDVCVNPRRSGFLRILQNAHADIFVENKRELFGETVADIRVESSELQQIFACEADVCDAIDEIPVLAALAIATRGKHVFCSVGELRLKESDRIAAIVHMAEACGCRADFDGQNLTILSNGIVARKPRFDTFGDHRIAMSQAVLALSACGGGSLSTDNMPANPEFCDDLLCPEEACFATSFPNFLKCAGVCPMHFALVGEHVCDSLSPILMRQLAAQADVCCSYTPISLSQDVTDNRLKAILDRFDGANITMPFKTRAARIFSGAAASVNTVGRNIAATSTDGFGLIEALKLHGLNVENAPLWIVGAGGAAEACIAELLKHGCRLQIFNRTPSHAEKLILKYSLPRNVPNPKGVLSFVPECEFENQILLPRSVEFVFTAYYKGSCNLRRQAESRGIVCVDGLEMLFFQGAKSFSLWTNTPGQTDYTLFRGELQSSKGDMK